MNEVRQKIYNYFIKVAREENEKKDQIKFSELFDKNDNKRLLLVIKESLTDAFLITAILPELKKKYPKHDIYIGTEPKYFEVFDGNKFVYKTIPYISAMENEHFMIGSGGGEKFVDTYIHSTIFTQRITNYISQ